MKVRFRIEALSIEADWLRAGRADFADALRAALERELGEAARRGDFTTGRRTERRSLAIPAPVLVSPQAAGRHIARAVGGEIAPRERPPAPGRGRPS
jgi:hypothetical protein